MEDFFKGRLKNFNAAINGFKYYFTSQINAKIELAAVIVVLTTAYIFNFTKSDFIICILCCVMVITLEIMNTAIEILVDKISPEYNKTAGMIKDVSAAAVLTASAGALIIFIILLNSYL